MASGEAAGRASWIALGLIVLAIGAKASFADDGVIGPQIVFFGLIRADDTVVDPSGTDASGRPVYDRPFGFGFSLVVEARRGASNRPPSGSTFGQPGCPDLEIQVSRALGDGSTAICDTVPPDDGGVPAIDPPQLDGDDGICDALNDLGCRFVDGAGEAQGRTCSEGCVLFPSGELGCVSDRATIQFCGRMAKSAEFPVGETLVTTRVRDTAGNFGEPAQIVVRIASPTTTPTVTPTPTCTLMPSATRRPYDNDDGCAIGSPNRTRSGRALAFLVVPGLLLGLRSRRRAGFRT